MPKFLFWNLGRREIIPLVKLTAERNDVDLVILAESPVAPLEAQSQLNERSGDFRYALGRCPRVQFFSRFDDGFLTPVTDTDKYSIRRLRLPARQEILVVGAHLPSQMNSLVADIAQECRFLSADIRRAEASEGHTRTVLMGDLNLNPFDEGLVQTTDCMRLEVNKPPCVDLASFKAIPILSSTILCGRIWAIEGAIQRERIFIGEQITRLIFGTYLTMYCCVLIWHRHFCMINFKS